MPLHAIRICLLISLSCIGLALIAQKDTFRKLVDDKKYKEAYQLADKELKKQPEDAEWNYMKWKASLLAGMDVKANFPLINKAIELNPSYSEAYCERGLFFLNILRFDDAKEDFEAAIKFANTDSLKNSALLGLGSYYSSTRQHEKAVAVYLSVLKQDSLNPGALNNLAMGYQDLGKFKEALEILYKIEKLNPDVIYAVVNIGFVLTKLEDYATAVTYFNKAEKISKEEPLIYSNRAFAKYKLKDYSGALTDINKSIKMFETNSYAYMVRARIYLDKGEKEKACADLYTSLQYKYTEMYGDDVKELRDKHCIK
jgi:tetratricopeptide (TPR) repeat protein